MTAKLAASINYLNLRAAEIAAQRALLIAGLPLALIQPHFNQKIQEAHQQMQEQATKS